VIRWWLRVARPDDWTGRVALGVRTLIGAVLVVASLLARLPPAWVELAWGLPELVRALLCVLALLVTRELGAVIDSLLPGAAVLRFGRLRMRSRGRRSWVRVGSIRDVFIERRAAPAGETFVLALDHGEQRDICPVRWAGAPRLFAALRRHVQRQSLQRAAEVGRALRASASASGRLDSP
jgi:hypothetical protein